MNALQKIDNMMDIIESIMECDDIEVIKKKVLFLGYRIGELGQSFEINNARKDRLQ